MPLPESVSATELSTRLFDGRAGASTLDVMVVVAHPDDETVGLGAHLPKLPKVRMVYVTDGAPRDLRDARAAGFVTRQAYARARHDELHAALTMAGVDTEGVHFVGLVDQEASLHLVDLSQTVEALLQKYTPDAVITHPYEGGHPDHDATAFAVHTACHLLNARAEPVPIIVEGTFYHNRSGEMATGEFLPRADGTDVCTRILSEEQRAFKRRMYDCYVTQHHMLRLFPVEVERFRPAPHYDFERAPHEGQLFYEMFEWGMTGPRWRNLAREALVELGFDRYGRSPASLPRSFPSDAER